MFAVAVGDILALIAIVAICGGMLVLANRIEPHWVAKDEQRFLTVAQDLDQFGLPSGRRREVRVHLDPDDDALFIRGRSITRPSSGIWVVQGKAPKAPRGRVVYILKKVSGGADTDRMMLRLPAKSRMIPRMEELLAATTTPSSPKPAPPDVSDAED